MIDLVLHSASKGALLDWAIARNIAEQTSEGPRLKAGLDYCLWAGTGRFMTQAGTYDAEGVEITPPSFLAGTVALLRIYTAEDEIAEGQAQWQRSKVAKAIRNNGTYGTTAGGSLEYYEWEGVRLFLADQVFAWLATKGLPGHEWLGGNAL